MAMIEPQSARILDDAELVHQAKEGSVEAFGELVNRHDRKIFRLTQHITRNREDAEDALQETFLKAYSRLSQFAENSQFYTWLVRIAVNESLMKLRKRKGDASVSLDDPMETEEGFVPREIGDWGNNPEQQYAQQELHEILDRTVNSLPAQFRTVFILRDMEQLSTEETAEALNLSVSAVKSRLLRARLQLREKLNRHFQRGKLSC
ncbi:MAG: sigma-70 family RNA polymerase sigma factor [Acidobacteria bacterium]|nr:sigma-70 family RNA polymerase sigma factor [Acidobacteriota bacterium]